MHYFRKSLRPGLSKGSPKSCRALERSLYLTACNKLPGNGPCGIMNISHLLEMFGRLSCEVPWTGLAKTAFLSR